MTSYKKSPNFYVGQDVGCGIISRSSRSTTKAGRSRYYVRCKNSGVEKLLTADALAYRIKKNLKYCRCCLNYRGSTPSTVSPSEALQKDLPSIKSTTQQEETHVVAPASFWNSLEKLLISGVSYLSARIGTRTEEPASSGLPIAPSDLGIFKTTPAAEHLHISSLEPIKQRPADRQSTYSRAVTLHRWLISVEDSDEIYFNINSRGHMSFDHVWLYKNLPDTTLLELGLTKGSTYKRFIEEIEPILTYLYDVGVLTRSFRASKTTYAMQLERLTDWEPLDDDEDEDDDDDFDDDDDDEDDDDED